MIKPDDSKRLANLEQRIARVDTRTRVTTVMLVAFMASLAGVQIARLFVTPDAPTRNEASGPLYFIEPADGERVASEFKVKFGLSEMGVAPAGVNIKGTGHHHLLIDTEQLPDMSRPLPVSDQILHFGKGQTQTTLTLPSGKHTLQLVLGDYAHTPHKPPVVSKKITIQVD